MSVITSHGYYRLTAWMWTTNVRHIAFWRHRLWICVERFVVQYTEISWVISWEEESIASLRKLSFLQLICSICCVWSVIIMSIIIEHFTAKPFSPYCLFTLDILFHLPYFECLFCHAVLQIRHYNWQLAQVGMILLWDLLIMNTICLFFETAQAINSGSYFYGSNIWIHSKVRPPALINHKLMKRKQKYSP